MLSAQEKTILKQFKNSLKQTLGCRLVELKLFGSKARGDDQPDSDIDVLVIVTTDDWRICDTVYNVATDLSLETDIYISAKVISKNRFDQLRRDGTPFLRNVSKDAISV
jgi:predicted nucleotidyltransferase